MTFKVGDVVEADEQLAYIFKAQTELDAARYESAMAQIRYQAAQDGIQAVIALQSMMVEQMVMGAFYAALRSPQRESV